MVNQTFELRSRAVPKQSLRARSKCDSAPGPSVAADVNASTGSARTAAGASPGGNTNSMSKIQRIVVISPLPIGRHQDTEPRRGVALTLHWGYLDPSQGTQVQATVDQHPRLARQASGMRWPQASAPPAQGSPALRVGVARGRGQRGPGTIIRQPASDAQPSPTSTMSGAANSCRGVTPERTVHRRAPAARPSRPHADGARWRGLQLALFLTDLV